MGQKQLIDKLTIMLNDLEARRYELDEKVILYFLVEARKMLEHNENAGSFPAIKFYADWAVHTRKDYAPTFIEEIIQGSGSYPEKFVSMEHLRGEVMTFLDEYGLRA